jgi:AAA+ ATPase superfamily predicted ATPase
VWDDLVRFLNRSDELAMLREHLEDNGAELLVVYGRRGVGKTELLAQLASEVRSLYFEATDTVALDQLRDFSGELARAAGSDVHPAQPLTSWAAALAALAEFVGSVRTFVVLAEFQHPAARSPALETVLSRWWRTKGRDLPITLILTGSERCFFETEVPAGSLYGRRTGPLRLTPFIAAESALFHPGYGCEDRVRAHSVCGGTPYYLEQFTNDRPLAQHVLTEVFSA